jgi:hypothetical protein
VDKVIGFLGRSPQVPEKVEQEDEANQVVIELEQLQGFFSNR